jgi:hypothetical protein
MVPFITTAVRTSNPIVHVLAFKPFKDHLKQLYSEWLLVGHCVLIPSGTVPVDQHHGSGYLPDEVRKRWAM